MKDDLILLIERYLGGEAAPEDVRRLDELVLQDPEALRELLLAADQDAHLRKALSIDAAPSTAPSARAQDPVERSEAEAQPPTRRRAARVLRHFRLHSPRSSWTPMLAAAAVLVGLTVLLTLLIPESRPTPPAGVATPRLQENTRLETQIEPPRENEMPARRRLAQIEEERRKLLEPRSQPEAAHPGEETRKDALARLEEERRRLEEEMKRAAEKTQQTRPPPSPENPRPDPEPQTPPAKTRAAIAKVRRVDGRAFVVGSEGRQPAQAGRDILAGEGLDTESKSGAAIAFPDETVLDVASETEVRELCDREAPTGGPGGKRLLVSRGIVTAEVARQPKDRPMVIATPHAEATVLGTRLSVVVEPDSTRLEVTEGKARLRRLADGKSVDVASGCYAVAAAGIELASRESVGKNGLKLWLRADAGVALNETSVAAWTDQSGSGTHARQKQRRCQPTFVPHSVNGRPAVRFDGKQQFLAFNMPIDGLIGMTITLVAAPDAEDPLNMLGSPQYTTILWTENADWGVTHLGLFRGKVNVRFGTTEENRGGTFYPPAPVGTRFYVLTATHRENQEAVHLDGRPLGTVQQRLPTIGGATGQGLVGKGFVLKGEDTFWTGEIAEIVVHARALDNAERRGLERELARKYAIQLQD